MCVAIYSIKNNDIPSKEYLKNCFKSNPDGCGFAFSYKGIVHTYKGYFSFDKFYKKLLECDRRYNLKEQGVILHFRIATHGLINAANCHPFALTSNENKLKATFTKSKFSVVHNGICSCCSTFSKKETLSDTALFVKDYLSLIATFENWNHNPHMMDLVERMIDSKMAILSGDGSIYSTSGFHCGSDGNFYSNHSYLDNSYFYGYNYGYLDDWYDDYSFDEDELAVNLMRLQRNERIIFSDGNVEEYCSDYHEIFPTFVSEDNEVYTLFENVDYIDRIPFSKLSFMGTGEIVDSFFTMSNTEIKVANFRKDAEAIL